MSKVVVPSLSALRISSTKRPSCCFSGRNVCPPTKLFQASTIFNDFQPLLASLPSSSSSSSSSSSQAGRFKKRRGIESPPRLFCSKETQHNGLPHQEQLDANANGQTPSEVNDSPHSASVGDSFLNILGELFVGSGENSLSSIKTVVFWVCAAVAFGSVIWLKEGTDKASEFFAGYLLEQSLSVDNLFVFVLVFKYFKVPQSYQGKVLFYGIAGAIVFRATIILLGTATIQRFEAINLLLAAILLFSAYKLFGTGEEEEDLSNNFILKTCQKFISVTPYYVEDKFITIEDGVRKATPLLLTLAVIEFSDIAFAVDSIPAVFGVTRDPFIVFSSNFFAIVGLRSLYTLISSGMSQLNYLQPSIGVVLGFIGCKMIFDYFGFHISTEVSLAFVALCLGTGITLSLTKGKSSED